jgi:hypothetical protein
MLFGGSRFIDDVAREGEWYGSAPCGGLSIICVAACVSRYEYADVAESGD